MQHSWGHRLLLHFKFLDWWLWFFLPQNQWWYQSIWHHQCRQVIQGRSGSLSVINKEKLCVSIPQVDGTVYPHSMACEVLPQGKCEPAFPNIQTLARKQDFKWPPAQHHGQYFNRGYCFGLLTQDMWLLGSHSEISVRPIKKELSPLPLSTRKM